VAAILAIGLCVSNTARSFAQASPSPAPASSADGVLVVGGDVAMPLALSVAVLKTWPRVTATVDEDGRSVVYEGVALAEILERAGAPLGAALRGNNLASYVLATARDGYQVVFSLAEIDPAFTKNGVIVADTADGKPLFDYQGPLRIVAPRDSRPARSVRMLQRLDVATLRK
jgi:hypothetical protein